MQAVMLCCAVWYSRDHIVEHTDVLGADLEVGSMGFDHITGTVVGHTIWIGWCVTRQSGQRGCDCAG